MAGNDSITPIFNLRRSRSISQETIVVDRDFVYICSSNSNYIWGLAVSLSAGHRYVIVQFRSLRHGHRPTAFAGEGPFELYEHVWRTCLASAADRRILPPPIQSLFVPLDCFAHVTYRNWGKILEYDVVVSRA